ncbi:hypothetical protein FSP39_010250 [Pinctada imbricata]|uniref:Fido domain-containing protein n=1 Tax=Pinctada imbricata TaxID=66713 RepID=A0AA88YC11_PINIB|nr:hypothetical protein FSP39_010250 [Pinctada imbricata]
MFDRLTSSPRKSPRKFYGRYEELVIHYNVPFSRMSYINVRMGTRFLDFEYSAHVRDGQSTTTGQMVQDICSFREAYNKNKGAPGVGKITHELELCYVIDILKARDIGVKDPMETRKIFEELKSTNTIGIVRNIHPSNESRREATVNVFRAYEWIKELMKDLSDEEKNSLARHLVTRHLVELHEKLMEGIFIPRFGLRPGEFTTDHRGIEPEPDKFIPYHKFETKAEVQNAVDRFLHNYNEAIAEIKKMKDTKERIEAVFKCAAKLIFGVGLIHPFIDGNGRTSRLLCFYCLSLIAPFPTPVYGVYSPSSGKEFGDSLMEARGGDNSGEETLEKLLKKAREAKPSKLCAILIEANWHMWKKFLSDLKIKV